VSAPSNPNYGTQGYGQGGYGNEPVENLPIGYYLQLLTSQYTLPQSPKLNALLKVLLQKFDDVSQVLVKMDTALDLDVAVGAQLDMLGSTVGATRTVGFQPNGGVSPVLDDATYRIYIKAKIAQNQWDGTLPSLYPIWANLFPDGSIIIIDNQNMTADITLKGSFTSIIQDLIVNGYIVPRPEGVLYTYLFGTLPFFGFGSSPGFIAGFGAGHWV
jgi:Protein of unknown function (DUF2612)